LVAAFAYDLARLFGLGLFALPPGFGALPAEEALRQLAAEAKRLDLLPVGLEGEELGRRFAVFEANFRAMERYAGGSCSVPLVLLRATERAETAAEPEDLGWSRLLGRPIEVHTLPGDHYALLARTQAESLAAFWRGAGDGMEAAADPPLTETPA
jgi:surfactin synthase thioesterase subunit